MIHEKSNVVIYFISDSEDNDFQTHTIREAVLSFL